MADGIPKVALGTWLLGADEVMDVILYAFEEAGYRHLDCAELYGNEAAIGVALNALFSRGKVKREDIFITSKIWNTHHTPAEVEICLRRTLANLQCGYLDLYLIHWPCTFVSRPDGDPLPRDDTGTVVLDRSKKVLDMWPEMERMIELGLTKHIGVSNFTIEFLEKMRFDPRVKIQPFANQVEYNLYMQQEAMRNYLEFRGIYLDGYAPLGTAGGDLLNDPVLKEVAAEVGKDVGAVALRFLLQICPIASVLPKSKSQARIKSNIELGFDLTDEQIAKLKGREKCVRSCDCSTSWKIDLFGDRW
jgi:aldehyde reductase